MNAYETRKGLRAGLANLGIKEKEIWNKEGNESFEEPDLSNAEISTEENIVFIQNDIGGYSINVADLIKAAYDNHSYGGMISLERMRENEDQ